MFSASIVRRSEIWNDDRAAAKKKIDFSPLKRLWSQHRHATDTKMAIMKSHWFLLQQVEWEGPGIIVQSALGVFGS